MLFIINHTETQNGGPSRYRRKPLLLRHSDLGLTLENGPNYCIYTYQNLLHKKI